MLAVLALLAAGAVVGTVARANVRAVRGRASPLRRGRGRRTLGDLFGRAA